MGQEEAVMGLSHTLTNRTRLALAWWATSLEHDISLLEWEGVLGTLLEQGIWSSVEAQFLIKVL